MLFWIYRVNSKARPSGSCLFSFMTGPRSSRRRHPAPRRSSARERSVQDGSVPENSPYSREFPTRKRRGELAELAFTLKVASLGFSVSKPYGDSDRYDFILDARDDSAADLAQADVGADAMVRPALRLRRTGTSKKLSFRRASAARRRNLLLRHRKALSTASRSNAPPSFPTGSTASTRTAAPTGAPSPTSPTKSTSSPPGSSRKTPGTSSRSPPSDPSPASCSAASATPNPAFTTPTAKPGICCDHDHLR
jgi:PD-(D/E)XK endonuclease